MIARVRAKRELFKETGLLPSAMSMYIALTLQVRVTQGNSFTFKATELSKDKPRHESPEVITDIEIITYAN